MLAGAQRKAKAKDPSLPSGFFRSKQHTLDNGIMDLIFESQKLVEWFCCTPFRLDFVEEFLPYDFEGAIMVARDDDIFLFEC